MPTRAAEIYAGRFVFAGKIVTCHGRSVFDLEPPSEDWEVALLGFGWLRHLRAARYRADPRQCPRAGRRLDFQSLGRPARSADAPMWWRVV